MSRASRLSPVALMSPDIGATSVENLQSPFSTTGYHIAISAGLEAGARRVTPDALGLAVLRQHPAIIMAEAVGAYHAYRHHSSQNLPLGALRLEFRSNRPSVFLAAPAVRAAKQELLLAGNERELAVHGLVMHYDRPLR
jgi:hypothetical protein